MLLEAGSGGPELVGSLASLTPKLADLQCLQGIPGPPEHHQKSLHRSKRLSNVGMLSIFAGSVTGNLAKVLAVTAGNLRHNVPTKASSAHCPVSSF